MALYIDNHYLNSQDSEFVKFVQMDLSRFLEAATTNENQVLVFPAVSSYHRFLVHKSVEELPTLCSFSIGIGEQRRPVVCLEQAVMRDEKKSGMLRSVPVMPCGQEQVPVHGNSTSFEVKPSEPDMTVVSAESHQNCTCADVLPNIVSGDGDALFPGTACDDYCSRAMDKTKTKDKDNSDPSWPSDIQCEIGPVCCNSVALSSETVCPPAVSTEVKDTYEAKSTPIHMHASLPDSAATTTENLARADIVADVLNSLQNSDCAADSANIDVTVSSGEGTSTGRHCVAETSADVEPCSLPAVMSPVDGSSSACSFMNVCDLSPELKTELELAVGDIAVLLPQFDYCNYLAESLDILPAEYNRAIEIYDIPKGLITRDLLSLFRQFRDKHFDVKWVDVTHAIGIFSTKEMAHNVVKYFSHAWIKVQPLHLASNQTKLAAKKCSEFFVPHEQRPKTTAAAAINILTGALGVRHHKYKEQPDNSERYRLKKSSRDRNHGGRNGHDEENTKRRTWDGKLRPCAMDCE